MALIDVSVVAEKVQEEAGQDNDPARPERYSRPWNSMSSSETGELAGKGCSGTGWASINRW